MGSLILALVFFASGATFLKNSRPSQSGGSTPSRGLAAMPAKRKSILGGFLLVVGVLVLGYWLVSIVSGG
ncbi:MAG: hypothetical protein FWD75_10105 [Propionibacteriaceae bacterium]|nr:hypothetical protein [Propionibacteriaceae bacterium]